MYIYWVHTVCMCAEIKGALYTNKAMPIFVVCFDLLKLCPCIYNNTVNNFKSKYNHRFYLF